MTRPYKQILKPPLIDRRYRHVQQMAHATRALRLAQVCAFTMHTSSSCLQIHLPFFAGSNPAILILPQDSLFHASPHASLHAAYKPMTLTYTCRNPYPSPASCSPLLDSQGRCTPLRHPFLRAHAPSQSVLNSAHLPWHDWIALTPLGCPYITAFSPGSPTL